MIHPTAEVSEEEVNRKCPYMNTTIQLLTPYTVTERRHNTRIHIVVGCLGGAAIRRRTRDRKVAGSTPSRGAIKSTRSTQSSIPPE